MVLGMSSGSPTIPPPIPIGLIRGEDHGTLLVTPGDEQGEQIGSQTVLCQGKFYFSCLHLSA